jgi:hypothetical protein
MRDAALSGCLKILPMLLLLLLLPAVQVRRVLCSYSAHPRVWQQHRWQHISSISSSSSAQNNQQGVCTLWLAWQAEAAAGQCCL